MGDLKRGFIDHEGDFEGGLIDHEGDFEGGLIDHEEDIITGNITRSSSRWVQSSPYFDFMLLSHIIELVHLGSTVTETAKSERNVKLWIAKASFSWMA